MKTSILLLACLCLGCASRDPVADAKAVAKLHEDLTKAASLEGMLVNIADDYVGCAPGVPLIKGKAALREKNRL